MSYRPLDSGLLVPSDIETRSVTLENPAVPLSDPRVLESLGTGTSTSGPVRVTPTTILTFGPVYAAVKIISDDVATMPVDVKRRVGRGKEPDRRHPAQRLLKREPNRLQDSITWRKQMMCHVLIWGNHYTLVDRDGAGRPVELIPLLPDRTRPKFVEGQLFYETQNRQGETLMFFASDILHIRGLTHDGIEGIPVWTLLRLCVEGGISMERYSRQFFANAARASGVLMHPRGMSKKAQRNLAESFVEKTAGVDNAGKVLLLEEGAKWQPTTVPNNEAQFLESLQEKSRQVAAVFRIPPHFLGDPTRTSYKSLESENRAYLTRGLNPHLRSIESEAWRRLLSEEEKEAESHSVEFNRGQLMQADLAAQTAHFHVMKLDGNMTANEIREKLGMNPIDDPAADQLLIPTNMMLAEDVAGEEDDEPDDDEEKDEDKDDDDEGADGPEDDKRDNAPAYRNLVAGTMHRLARLEADSLGRAKTGQQIEAALDRSRQRIAEALAPVLAVVAPHKNPLHLATGWTSETLKLAETDQQPIDLMGRIEAFATYVVD